MLISLFSFPPLKTILPLKPARSEDPYRTWLLRKQSVILLKEMAGEEVEVVRVMDVKTLGSEKPASYLGNHPQPKACMFSIDHSSSNSTNDDQMMGQSIVAGHISECEV